MIPTAGSEPLLVPVERIVVSSSLVRVKPAARRCVKVVRGWELTRRGGS